MDILLRDLRNGIRRLQRDRLLTVTAVVSLALGIGANTAIYTVVSALLYRPQPGISAPDRLIDIGRTQAGYGFNPVSYPDYLALAARATKLEHVYAYTMFPNAMTLMTGAVPHRVFTTTVSGNYFTTLGIAPAAGRLFRAADREGITAAPVIVIGDETWTRVFGRRPDIPGQPVTVNGRPFTVIGVAPPGFHGTGLRRADAWIPIGAIRNGDTGMLLTATESAWLMTGGRLKPNVAVDAAAAELSVIGRTLPSSARQPDRGLRATPLSPVAGGAGPVRAFLIVLIVTVGAVLVVACANVAGMLLSQAPLRRREMAVRAAMGATHRLLTRQLLTETVVLCGTGAVLGLAVAWVLTRVVLAMLPALPFPVDLSLPIDGQALLFTSVMTLVAALVSGLAPAFRGARVDLTQAMRADSEARHRMRLRRGFVVSQVAISAVLVIVGALFLRALHAAGALDPGFDARGVDLVTVELTNGAIGDTAAVPILASLLERVRIVPNVAIATASFSFPGGFEEFRLGQISRSGVGEQLNGDWNVVEPGYFAAIRMPLVAGRDFAATDRAGSQPVVILGEGVVRRLWPGRAARDAVDAIVDLQQFRPGGGTDTIPLQVVGVVRDPAYGTLVDGATDFHAYVPFAQQPMPRMMLVARTRDGNSAVTEIRETIAAVNPALTIAATYAAEQYSTLGLLPQRIGAMVTAALGAIGVLLAAVGVFGVTAHAVIRRAREIGIRIALGAAPGSVARLILNEGMSLVALGALLGLGTGIGAAKLVAGYLAGLPPLDPVAFGGAVVVFGAAGLAACAVPIRRALRIAPIEALRHN